MLDELTLTQYSMILKVNYTIILRKKTEELHCQFVCNTCESIYFYEKRKHTHKI